MFEPKKIIVWNHFHFVENSRLFAVPLMKSLSLLSNYMWSGSTSSRFTISRLFYFILFYISLVG